MEIKTVAVCGSTFPLKISSSHSALDGLRIGWAEIVAPVPEKGAYAYEAHLEIEGNAEQFGLVVSLLSNDPECRGNCAFIHETQLKELGADISLDRHADMPETDPAMAGERIDVELVLSHKGEEYGPIGRARLLCKAGRFEGFAALCWLPRLLSACVAPVTVINFCDQGGSDIAFVDGTALEASGINLFKLAPESDYVSYIGTKEQAFYETN